jgi:hypothetical protein
VQGGGGPPEGSQSKNSASNSTVRK